MGTRKHFTRRILVLQEQLLRKHPLLGAYARNAKRPDTFTSFGSVDEFEAFVRENGARMWINEVIQEANAELGIPPPRFMLDIDHVTDGPDADFDAHLRVIEASVFAAVCEIARVERVEDMRVHRVFNSRAYGDKYKNSVHLIFPGILVHRHAVEARTIADRVKKRLRAAMDVAVGHAGMLCDMVDTQAYLPMQLLRVAGSCKEQGLPMARAEAGLSFADTLVMGTPLEEVDAKLLVRTQEVRLVARQAPRKRKAREQAEDDTVCFDHAVVQALLAFFKSTLGRVLGWHDLEVQGMRCFGETSEFGKMFSFRVVHALPKAPHFCAAREKHNGGSNHAFFIRARAVPGGYELATKCFPNNRGLRCQVPGKDASERKNIGSWIALHTPPRNPEDRDAWSKRPLLLSVTE